MDSIVDTLMNQLTTKDKLSAISKLAGWDEKKVQSNLNMGFAPAVRLHVKNLVNAKQSRCPHQDDDPD